MIDLILSVSTTITKPDFTIISNNLYPPVTCDMITTVPKVCNKRKVVRTNHPTKYYLTLTDGRGEFEVDKCTYLASYLYGYYVIESYNYWCKNEP